MCGIFAWAGRNPATFNAEKFNILGIMNETRGKHSCGVTTNGDIIVGVEQNKLYRDFIVNSGFENPKKFPSVIGHTRHATAGSHNKFNAHPFGFGKMGDKYKFVGVHNGSLVNEDDIAKKRNIKTKVTYRKAGKKNQNARFERSKIDSEILLESIYRDANFKVLEEYDGAAALIFTDLSKPNTVYFYHGASKEWNASKTIVEERPLYYYQESKYSLYVSSIKESLKLIAGVDNENLIGEFKHNVVYEVKNGNIESALKYNIDRSKRCQKASSYGYNHNAQNRNSCGFNGSEDDDYEDYYGLGAESFVTPRSNITTKTEFKNIYSEVLGTSEKLNNKIYYELLRFRKDKEPITGCCIFIPTYGYYFLSEKIDKAKELFWKLVNQRFYNNDFVTKNQVITDKMKKESFIPYVNNDDHKILSVPLYFFFEGVRVGNMHDYTACLDSKNSNGSFDTLALSHCSVYPICDDVNYKTTSEQNILLDGEPYSGIIAPLGSSKTYHISKGKLLNWSPILEDFRSKNTDVNYLTEVVDNLENKNKDMSKVTSVALEKEIEEVFTPIFEKLTNTIEKFKTDYKDQEKGRQAIDIMDDFLDQISEFVGVEVVE